MVSGLGKRRSESPPLPDGKSTITGKTTSRNRSMGRGERIRLYLLDGSLDRRAREVVCCTVRQHYGTGNTKQNISAHVLVKLSSDQIPKAYGISDHDRER